MANSKSLAFLGISEAPHDCARRGVAVPLLLPLATVTPVDTQKRPLVDTSEEFRIRLRVEVPAQPVQCGAGTIANMDRFRS